MSMPTPANPVHSLPDPLAWTTGMVEVVGEARRGNRPWKQVYPLLDLPVVSQVWPDRRVRYPPPWRVVKVIGQSPAECVWGWWS